MQFQKLSIPSPWRITFNSKGESQNSEGTYEGKLEFLDGLGHPNQNNSYGRGTDMGQSNNKFIVLGH